MNLKHAVLNLTRLGLSGLSILVLLFHILQIVFLVQMPGIGNFFPSYAPYSLYFVGPILSFLSGNILVVAEVIGKSNLLLDRVLGVFNFIFLVIVLIYNTVKSGQVPWMGNLGYDFTSDAKGWVPYCAQYTFINTNIRCWFQNAVWLGIILMILNWFFLLALTFFVGERKADTDYDRYDFKDDVPMAQNSVPGSVNQQEHQSQ